MDPIDLICFKCKHFTHSGCIAFPGDMPKEILINNKHDKPVKGQIGDYVFEPKEEEKED